LLHVISRSAAVSKFDSSCLITGCLEATPAAGVGTCCFVQYRPLNGMTADTRHEREHEPSDGGARAGGTPESDHGHDLDVGCTLHLCPFKQHPTRDHPSLLSLLPYYLPLFLFTTQTLLTTACSSTHYFSLVLPLISSHQTLLHNLQTTSVHVHIDFFTPASV